MATEPITGTVAQVNDNGFKLRDGGWINYSQIGKGYSGPTFIVGQQISVVCVEWKGRWYAETGSVTVATNPGPAPAASPAPSPAPSYQATHDAAQERVTEAPVDAPPPPAAWDTAAEQDAARPGTFPFRDLSIMRQNRLNVAKDCLIANLENCPAEEKAGRMITAWSVAEFERLLVEGAAYDEEGPPEASYQPEG